MKYIFQKNGITKKVKHGFSWTVFFWGWIALAIRGQYAACLITLATFGFGTFYYMFAANRLLARDLIADGWTCAEELPAKWLAA